MKYFVSKKKLLNLATAQAIKAEESYRGNVGTRYGRISFREMCAEHNALSYLCSQLGMNLAEAIKAKKKAEVSKDAQT